MTASVRCGSCHCSVTSRATISRSLQTPTSTAKSAHTSKGDEVPTLREIQVDSRKWRAFNFPDHTIEDQFMGMAEELGELGHALLKHKQGIRQVGDDTIAELVADAYADLNIFAFGVLDKLGIDATDALSTTWQRVRGRNWVDDPQKGGEE